MVEVLDITYLELRTSVVTLLVTLFAAFGAELALRLFTRGMERTRVKFAAAVSRALFWWPLVLLLVPGLLAALSLLLPPFYARLLQIGARWFFSIGSALLLVRALLAAVRYAMERNGVASVTILRNIGFALYGLIALAMLLQLLGISITPLLTVIAGSSVGIAFALREPLANLFAGLQMLASNRVQPGQFVRLSGGQEGVITDIHWSDTYLRHPANNLVIVPNSKLTQDIVVNYDRPDDEVGFSLDLGVSYDSDLDHVERVTLEEAQAMLREVPGGAEGAEPSISYSAFGDYAIRFSVNLRAASFGDQFRLKHELIKRLVRRYRQEGITIPFPTQTLQGPEGQPLDLGDGAQPRADE